MNKLLILIFCVFSTLLNATTFDELVENNEVVVNAYLSHQTAVVSEQVTINIEVLSRYPFSETTAIKHMQIANTIVMKQGPFAINSIKTINGQQYTHQLWEIQIYPQQSGKQVIPPITVKLGVKKDQQSLIGELKTPQLTFSTYTPSPYMTSENHWVVAKKAELTETVDVLKRDKDKEVLQVGDVVEREVVLKALGSTAMLFPTLLAESDYESEIAQQYVERGRYQDQDTRQGMVSQHIEKISLVVEQPGELLLPEIEVLWWDTETGSEQLLLLPGYQYQVQHTPASFFKAYWLWGVGIIALLLSLFIAFKKLLRHIRVLKSKNAMPVFYKFFDALINKQWGKAESAIYLRLKSRHAESELVNESHSTPWYKSAVVVQQKRYSSGEKEQVGRRRYYQLWQKL